VLFYRPVGAEELRLVEEAGWRRFPPRLPEQPLFYPVENEEYATQIARDWNVKSSGSGHVLCFDVDAAFLATYAIRSAMRPIGNIWIPAADLEEFNDHIIGSIKLIASFP